MATLSDEPNHSLLPLADSDENERRVALYRAVQEVIARHVSIGFNASTGNVVDGVMEYARKVLSMGMLFLEFRDAIREGDGERVFAAGSFSSPSLCQQDESNTQLKPFT